MFVICCKRFCPIFSSIYQSLKSFDITSRKRKQTRLDVYTLCSLQTVIPYNVGLPRFMCSLVTFFDFVFVSNKHLVINVLSTWLYTCLTYVKVIEVKGHGFPSISFYNLFIASLFLRLIS